MFNELFGAECVSLSREGCAQAWRALRNNACRRHPSWCRDPIRASDDRGNHQARRDSRRPWN